jgi:hypothetical protein
MLVEILTTLNIGEKVWRFIGTFRQPKVPQEEILSSRFVRLFECHNVHRNQIPRFFGNGLTVKDVNDDQSLLSKLDEPLLDAACNLFGVRREWLAGWGGTAGLFVPQLLQKPWRRVAILDET